MRLLLVAVIAFVASCACWEPSNAKYNTKECAISRAEVACGFQILPQALVQTLTALPTGQWDQLISQLESDGETAGACAVAGLVTASMSSAPTTAQPSPQGALVMQFHAKAQDHLTAYKQKYGYASVKFCFVQMDGKKVCQ